MNAEIKQRAGAGGEGRRDRAICAIVNAGSGKKTGAALAGRIEAAFAAHPGQLTLRLVTDGAKIGEAARQAVAEGFDTVVAAGGDGTICAVADALAGTETRMGVLPLGTFNYFAKANKLPEELEDAVAVVTEGQDARIAVGDVNGRVFLNNASLGAYAAILQRREQVYERWGRSRLAAYWSVLSTLVGFRTPLKLKVTVDGEVRRVRTPLVFVAMNAHQLDRFELSGADCIRDGKFALYIAPDGNGWDLIRMALRLATRTMVAERDFELLCGSDILVETSRRHRLVARDGERERMEGPFHFRVRPDALRVVVPEGVADITPGTASDPAADGAA